MLAAIVSLRVFILQLLVRELLYISPKKLSDVTKLSDRTPYLESFLVRHGIDRDVRVGYMRRSGTLLSIAGALTVCLFYFEE
jgi:hypothetical protein